MSISETFACSTHNSSKDINKNNNSIDYSKPCSKTKPESGEKV